MYHIFFSHSSVFGLLGCFHVLATVSSAMMNTEIFYSYFIEKEPEALIEKVSF